jgi:hypothetical protein
MQNLSGAIEYNCCRTAFTASVTLRFTRPDDIILLVKIGRTPRCATGFVELNVSL